MTQTEKKLNQAAENQQYELFNFGVSGYSLTEYKIILEQIPEYLSLGIIFNPTHQKLHYNFLLEELFALQLEEREKR